MVHSKETLDVILSQAAEALQEKDWRGVLRLTTVAEAFDPGNQVARALRGVAEGSLAVGEAAPALVVTADPATAFDPADLPKHRHEHSIGAVLSSVAELTPFSAVAFRLIELLDDDLASADDVARLASTDPALTARIIQAANSAFYRRRERVATIRDAVMVLGAREVRTLVITTCVVGTMPSPRVLDHHAFWQFSIATALLADLIARAEGDLSGEAFTAGVLHNVGLLVLDQYCPEGLREVVSLVGPGRRRLHDREELVFGFTDAALAARLAELWGLPNGVVHAIELHGLRREEVNPRDRIASSLVRARIFARAQGMSDGLEASPPRDPGEGFLPVRAQARLDQIGRWDDFLDLIDGLLSGRARH